MEQNIIKTLKQNDKEDLKSLERYIEEFSVFLPLAVCTINPAGVIVDINKSARDLFSYNELEVIGREISDLFVKKNLIKSLMEEIGKIDLIKNREMLILTKDQRKVPVSVSISPRKDFEGEVIGYFLAISDMTEVKKLQENLEDKVRQRTKELEDVRKALTNMLEDADEARKRIEEEQNKTRATLTSLVDGLIVFNKEGRIILVNPEAENILKLKEKQVFNKKIEETLDFPLVNQLYKTLGNKFELSDKKLELVIEPNKAIKNYFQITLTPVTVEKERVGLMVVLHNITRDKEIDRIKTEFVSVAAHQLRTPLSAIKWVIKMILDGDVGSINEEQKELLLKGYKSNERIIKLVNDLLNVSRIEEGRFGFEFAKSDFQEVLNIVQENLEEVITKSNLVLTVVKPDKLPPVFIDKERISIALQNLVDNAIKYTPEYGKIEIIVKTEGQKLRVTVKDSGVGIPKKDQEKLFSKFFRATNAVRLQTEGTGLGLFLVRNIIETHQGEIFISSEEGKGTEVSFTLPIYTSDIANDNKKAVKATKL